MPFGIPYGQQSSIRYTYIGMEKSSVTGLTYLNARYYDSSIGRFTQMDFWEGDLSNPQTLNHYVYCINDSISLYDISGNRFLREDEYRRQTDSSRTTNQVSTNTQKKSITIGGDPAGYFIGKDPAGWAKVYEPYIIGRADWNGYPELLTQNRVNTGVFGYAEE